MEPGGVDADVKDEDFDTSEGVLKPHEKNYYQLFKSNRIVTEDYELNGGILVDRNGVIINVIKKNEADEIARRLKNVIQVINAEDLVIMPGVVDSHVHVNEPGRTQWEGFSSATQAAAAGGVTTIVDMPLNSIPPTTTIENFKTKLKAAEDRVYVDVAFWGGVIPGNHESLKDLAKMGVVGFKCFLCPSGVDEFPMVQAADILKAFEALEGTGSVLAFHAELEESYPFLFRLENEDQSVGDSIEITKKVQDTLYEVFLETRPPSLEINAVRFITDLINKTDIRVHIVHVSSARVMDLLEKARETRLKAGYMGWHAGITAETCHHYLTLNAEDIPEGQTEFKCCPPIRDEANKEKLWRLLIENKMDMVTSDHSPCIPALKTTSFLHAWGGISSLQFGLPLFWTEAKERGLDLRFVVRKMCTSTAKLCRLDKKKGGIKPGLDADLVIFDPNQTFTVTENMIRHKNKLTPYIGWKLNGVVKMTFVRGNLVYKNNDIVGEPKGKLIINKFRREYPDYMYE